MANEFVVSVANIQLRDKENDIIALKGKTLLNSSLTQACNDLDINGGPGNKLLYTTKYGKTLDVALEDCTWKNEYIALNNGALIENGLKDYYIFDEAVTLVAGVGTLAETPVGKVYIEKANGTLLTITPNVKQIDIADANATSCKATYKYNTTVDSIVINADSFPGTYELTMFTETVNNSGKVSDLQIVVPNFKPSGNFEMNMTPTEALTSRLDGKSLADDNNNYAYIYKRLIDSQVDYTQIVAYPSIISLDLSEGDTGQISIIGIRGGAYANSSLDTSLITFASDDDTVAEVDSSGVVTPVAAGDCTITCTYGGLTDIVNITVED